MFDRTQNTQNVSTRSGTTGNLRIFWYSIARMALVLQQRIQLTQIKWIHFSHAQYSETPDVTSSVAHAKLTDREKMSN